MERLRKRRQTNGCVMNKGQFRPIHGYYGTRLYRRWNQMKNRCTNVKHKDYKDYGARGITLCAEWYSFIPFKDWALAHGYSDTLQIDRIRNNEGYSPDNCHFVQGRQNQQNKRNTHLLTAFGETKCIAAWSEDKRCLPKRQTLYARIARGWKPEDAISRADGRKT